MKSLIEQLSESLLVPQDSLKKIINSAPYSYKRFSIPKRNGKGLRHISQPSKSLKIIQRAAIDLLAEKIPVHTASTAYVKGCNIKENAMRHKDSKYLLKMDFSNFFPSISDRDLIFYVTKHFGEITESDKLAIKKIFFVIHPKSKEYQLSIGAPSSPFISNIVMYEFDRIMTEICDKESITYTRYADDITLSTNEKGFLFNLPKKILDILKDLDHPKLKINNEKTIFSSKKHNRHVTGITLNNEDEISLGRDRKRLIKSMVYKYKNKSLDQEDIYRLRGLVAFSKHIEPKFYQSLIKKYSLETIVEINKIEPEKIHLKQYP